MKKLGIVFGLSVSMLALSACNFGIKSPTSASSSAPVFSSEAS